MLANKQMLINNDLKIVYFMGFKFLNCHFTNIEGS